ncbi:hypothetical protein OPIT5_19705 [Opitutaceae bacterium TAV5]|nr:hypothetical protein OPIT5_19705 [Opitutaceae bacterium TAV5]
MIWLRRVCVYLGITLCATATMTAEDFARDLSRLHVDRLGGLDAIRRLTAMEVTGETRIAGQTLPFRMVAARPDRVWIETRAPGSTLVSGYDGNDPPWQRDQPDQPARRQSASDAREFKGDAQFDDLLIEPERRQISLDYLGMNELDGTLCYQLLATVRFTDQYSLFVDARTLLIVRRDSARRDRTGKPFVMRILYSDYRPVAGVQQPFRIRAFAGQELLHETIITRITPNPKIPDGLFSMPDASSPRAGSARR